MNKNKNTAVVVITSLLLSLMPWQPASAATPSTSNITGFKEASTKLTEPQQIAILNSLGTTPDAKSITCNGLFSDKASKKDKQLSEARAKAACSFAKKVFPQLKASARSSVTKTKKLIGQVQLSLQPLVVDHVPNETELTFANPRSLTDQPDAVKGLQVKPLYLIPSDGVDQYLDLNGQIARFLDEGNAFMDRGIGKRFAIDRLADGSYDIGFIKSEKSLAEIYELRESDESAISSLIDGTPFATLGSNRKILAIFFDGPGTDEFCGLGDKPGRYSIIATQGDCSGPANGMNHFESQVWVHEVLHNLGVDHVAEPCDLMGSYEDFGTTPCYRDELVTIDTQNRYYVNSRTAGVDILKSGVWENDNLRPNGVKGSCEPVSRDYWSQVVCSTGKVQLGPRMWCWADVETAQLQVLRKGKWSNLAKGKGSRTPWGNKELWSCDKGYESPTASITPKATDSWYRWVANGKAELPFKLLIQN
jgi:hypothetical protein